MLGRTNYNSPVRLDAANTQQVPAWARFDVGGHHTFDSTGDGNPGTVRANVINLFDVNCWIATTSHFLQNQLRTFMRSLIADF